MPVRILPYHPDISQNPVTYLSGIYTTGNSLNVQNSSMFLPGDYVVVGAYGAVNAEINQVTTSTGSGSLQLVGPLQYPHTTDDPVTRIDYNQYNIYRSITGLGGTYTLLTTGSFMVSQPLYSTYVDQTGLSTYSYKTTYLNTTASSESSGQEILASGFPFYALGSIQNRSLAIYVDQSGEFITLSSISDWCNELLSKFNRAVTDSESTPFANSTVFTPGNNEFTNIAQYNVEAIFLMEYSSDGGMTWATDVINPIDSRIKANNPIGSYTYKLEGDNLFIYTITTGSGGQLVSFPINYQVRMWFFTQQTPLAQQSDLLPALYRSYTDVFVDYCLMRANEQSRRFTESASYYEKKFIGGFEEAVDSIRGRINQGNKSMALTWIGQFPDW